MHTGTVDQCIEKMAQAAAAALAAKKKKQNEDLLAELEVGDLVEFPRGLYSHWGVYIGNEKIVHMCRDDVDDADGNVFFRTWHKFDGVDYNNACVKEENFWDVVKDSIAKKNNSKDEECPPLPPKEIKDRALPKIGSIAYSVLWNNCEHFAAWCRYDRHYTEQVDHLVVATAVSTATVLVVAGITYVVYNGRMDELKMAKANQEANLAVLRDLNVGDLVEFPRGLYSHWGVYIGNETIVHMCRDDDNDADGHAFFLTWATLVGEVDSMAIVRKENFWNVVKYSLARKHDSTDQEWDPLPSDEIKARALSKIGPISFNLSWSCCGGFSTWCRYGKSVVLKKFKAEIRISIDAIKKRLEVKMIIELEKKRKNDDKDSKKDANNSKKDDKDSKKDANNSKKDDKDSKKDDKKGKN